MVKKKQKKKKKSTSLKLTEYILISALAYAVRVLPLSLVKGVSSFLGNLFFISSKKRRNIAVENLTYAFGQEKGSKEIRKLARQSCSAIVLTFLESIKVRHYFTDPEKIEMIRSRAENIHGFCDTLKMLHDESNGCIIVTPHLGNWEILSHLISLSGIPLGVVARDLDNEYLEKNILSNRVADSHFIISRKNAVFTFHRTLRKGISIGMLPDQSTSRGLLIDFFGRKATTTPLPAVLAIAHNKPIVVVACCRKKGAYEYDLLISEPIRPEEGADRKQEIRRITVEITRQMESFIRTHPEQYMWMHNRWKMYKGKKEFLS